MPPAPVFFWKSAQTSTIYIDIPLLDAYSTNHRGVTARVEVGRRDGWGSIGDGRGREVTVYSASLRGTLRYKGLRYILLHLLTSAIAYISPV
jgi:hypothetical protein